MLVSLACKSCSVLYCVPADNQLRQHIQLAGVVWLQLALAAGRRVPPPRCRAGFALNVRPVWVDCPICTEEDEVDISQLPVLLPSAVASALLTSKLLQQVIVDRSHLRLYWQHMLLDYPRHELCDQPEENLERAILIVLWGDEGTSNRHSWMLCSWSPGQI